MTTWMSNISENLQSISTKGIVHSFYYSKNSPETAQKLSYFELYPLEPNSGNDLTGIRIVNFLILELCGTLGNNIYEETPRSQE